MYIVDDASHVVLMCACVSVSNEILFSPPTVFSTQTTRTIWYGIAAHAFAKVRVIVCSSIAQAFNVFDFLLETETPLCTPLLKCTSNRIISGRKFRLHVART